MASTAPQRPPGIGARPSTLGTVVAGLTGGLAIVSIMSMIGGPLATLTIVEATTRLWIAFALLIGVSFLSGLIVAIWKESAGLLAAAVAGLSASLLLLLIRTFLLEDLPHNRLVFGPPGLIAVPLAALAGGIVGQWLGGDRPHPGFSWSDSARVGLWSAGLWVSLEVVVRLVGTLGLGPIAGNLLAGDMLAILVGMPLIAWVVAGYGRMHGVDSADWEYRWTPIPLAAGLVAGLLAFGLMYGTARIDLSLWGGSDALPPAVVEGLRAAAWMPVLMLLANGLAGPASEELAWRGVIQTALVRAWGLRVGIIVTAVLFALKHALVDGSPGRLTTHLMLGLVFGMTRHRWGTASSTAAHVVANVIATGVVIATI